MEATDPSKLTINELKSALTEHGFIDKIPQNERKPKAYYVGMYKEYVLPILERQRAAKRRSDPAQLRDLVDSLPEEKSKQEAKRRQTVAVGKIASLSQAIKTEPAPLPKFEPAVPIRAVPLPPVSSVYPAPGSPLYPSPISHQPPYSSFAPVETRPVLASATPPRKASPVVSRESSPALRSRESSPALRQRPASPARPSESEDEIEITEEFYVDEDEHQREYRSAFLNCILVSIVLATVLGISLFLLPSLVRVPFIADNLDSWIPFGSGNQPPYYCPTGTLPSPIPSNPSRNCTRCPLYGICLGGDLRCGSGYVKERAKIEGKYVERCVRDEEEVRQMNDLREKIRGMLSEHAGGHECGTEGYTEPGLSQEVLRDKLFTEYLSSKGGRKDDPDRIRAFDKLFLGVMREFLLHPEYNVIIKDGQWSSTDKALPLICEMKQRLWELKWYLLFSLVVAAAIQGLLWKRSKRNTENQEAEAMVEEVKKLLSQQKEASRQNDRIPPFLPLVHVRDTLFHDNIDRKNKFSQKERLALWDRVVRLVSEDRRIRTTPQMVEGEQQATWEWVSKLITS